MILFEYNKRIEQLPSDGTAYFMPDDITFASSLLQSGMYSTEVNIINQFRDMFSGRADNKVFIDIGANVGTYTLVLGRVFGHTYAFEPNTHVYNIMCGNVALNGLSKKTTLVNQGLSDKKETLTYMNLDELGGNNMFVNDSNNLSHMYDFVDNGFKHNQLLEVNTLDSYNIENVGLIKIDVEGFELNVLKGAVETIEKSGFPPMLIESWDPNNVFDEQYKQELLDLRNNLIDYINYLGYKHEYIGNDLFYCHLK